MQDAVLRPEERIRSIPTAHVRPDPGQPRKAFDEAALRELASSIRVNGLLQPITVRPDSEPDRFMIVAGERRWRAHCLAPLSEIRCLVIEPTSTADVRVKQIIENDQRMDVTPLEQARSYQALMDETGWSVEQLAQHLGKAPWRITERTSLLKLDERYQKLLDTGNLSPSQAFEMSRLASPRAQATLFQAIKGGQCKTYNDLRAVATGLIEAEAQVALFEAPPEPTKEEKRLAKTFESRVDQLAAMLRAGIDKNEISAVRRVNATQAGRLADLLGAMQVDLRRLEVGLRTASVQAQLFAM